MSIKWFKNILLYPSCKSSYLPIFLRSLSNLPPPDDDDDETNPSEEIFSVLGKIGKTLRDFSVKLWGGDISTVEFTFERPIGSKNAKSMKSRQRQLVCFPIKFYLVPSLLGEDPVVFEEELSVGEIGGWPFEDTDLFSSRLLGSFFEADGPEVGEGKVRPLTIPESTLLKDPLERSEKIIIIIRKLWL